MTKIKKRIKNKKKKLQTSDYVLLTIFILMLIFVIYLLFRLKAAKEEYNIRKSADFTMPIIEKRLSTIQVSIENKKKDDVVTYRLNITNYRDGEVNKKDFKYQMYVEPTVDAKYTLTKDGKKNLLNEKNVTEIFDLPGKKKIADKYTLKIKLNKDIKDKQAVTIYVEGKY